MTAIGPYTHQPPAKVFNQRPRLGLTKASRAARRAMNPANARRFQRPIRLAILAAVGFFIGKKLA